MWSLQLFLQPSAYTYMQMKSYVCLKQGKATYTNKYLYKNSSSFQLLQKGGYIYYTLGDPNVKVGEAGW